MLFAKNQRCIVTFYLKQNTDCFIGKCRAFIVARYGLIINALRCLGKIVCGKQNEE